MAKMSKNWYRKAWEGLHEVADDYEADTLTDLAVRAGVMWRCEANDCGWTNPNFTDKCEACGAKKDATEEST